MGVLSGRAGTLTPTTEVKRGSPPPGHGVARESADSCATGRTNCWLMSGWVVAWRRCSSFGTEEVFDNREASPLHRSDQP